jgi:hypothetical protein
MPHRSNKTTNQGRLQMKMAKKVEERLEIAEIHSGEVHANILGTSPMIMNRFSQKAWQELLYPSERRSRATLEQSLKHDPVAEFRGAVYRNRDEKQPALIHVPNGAFHGALASAALDIPGAAKAKIERLTKITNVHINLFGAPQIFCAMVRNSDMNRTPDVRTRPIFPRWACTITISYIKTILTERTIVNLLAAAGVIIGIGDWRGQKGGPYGAFKLVDDRDKEFLDIVKTGGRVAQQKALDQPLYFDADTAELLTWFQQEVDRRERDLPSAQPKTRRVILERGSASGDGEFIGEEVVAAATVAAVKAARGRRGNARTSA